MGQQRVCAPLGAGGLAIDGESGQGFPLPKSCLLRYPPSSTRGFLHSSICRKDLQREIFFVLSCFLLLCSITVLSMYFALHASLEEIIVIKSNRKVLGETSRNVHNLVCFMGSGQ